LQIYKECRCDKKRLRSIFPLRFYLEVAIPGCRLYHPFKTGIIVSRCFTSKFIKQISTKPLAKVLRNINRGNEITFYELFEFGKAAGQMPVSFSFI
jgi:hypothetical protein